MCIILIHVALGIMRSKVLINSEPSFGIQRVLRTMLQLRHFTIVRSDVVVEGGLVFTDQHLQVVGVICLEIR